MTQTIQNYLSATRHATGSYIDTLSPEDGLAIAYVLSCQQDNHMVYVSPQIAGLGFTKDEWTGKPDMRLQQIHAEDMGRVEQALQRSRDTYEGFSCCYRLYDSDKKLHWIRDEASTLCDESETPLFIIGVMLDITGEKEIEAELNQHRHHLERNAERGFEQQAECATLPVPQASQSQNLASIDYWAARMIAVTRNDWIKHGYCRAKAMKNTGAATKLAPILQPDDCSNLLSPAGNWAERFIGSGEQTSWAGCATAA